MEPALSGILAPVGLQLQPLKLLWRVMVNGRFDGLANAS